MALPAHCPHCGGLVTPRHGSIGTCNGCQREVYANSKPTAGVLLEHGGRLLLVERALEPAKGLWDIPGGFLEEGERPEDGARRELFEELGLDLVVGDPAFTELNRYHEFHVLDLLFEATMPAGQELRPGDDVASCAWFEPESLPWDSLAFASTRRILERWLARRQSTGLALVGGPPVDLSAAKLIASFGPAFASGVPQGLSPEGGLWTVHDGALCGRIDEEAPAALWIDAWAAGDHAVAFDAWTVAPKQTDLNCYWEGSGKIAWGAEATDVGCTIAGLGGWWSGANGIERYPEGDVQALSRQLRLEPGRRYRVVAGRRGAADFLFVDGRLVMQLDDPEAPRRRRSRVAVATWQSHIHIRSLALYEL